MSAPAGGGEGGRKGGEGAGRARPIRSVTSQGGEATPVSASPGSVVVRLLGGQCPRWGCRLAPLRGGVRLSGSRA